jgi:hypothetical protein
MEYRIVAKPVIHQSVACDECRRRKSKCSGELPCELCTKRGVSCLYSRSKRKRSPPRQDTPRESLSPAVPYALISHPLSFRPFLHNIAADSVVCFKSSSTNFETSFRNDFYLDAFFKYNQPWLRDDLFDRCLDYALGDPPETQ